MPLLMLHEQVVIDQYTAKKEGSGSPASTIGKQDDILPHSFAKSLH